jgi:Recombination endonuclease VII
MECVPDTSWRGRAMRYGIGKPQWDLIFSKQNGKCALCDKNPEVVDHCHKKGIVRGLLCNGCNIKIEILDKDDDFLYKAMRYVGKNYAIQKQSTDEATLCKKPRGS